MNNVILIGMPGSGKSTVGVVLAKRLGYRFVDSDLVIQEQEGKLLHEIISEQGQEGFLKVENRINAGIQGEKMVLATGGSAIYGPDAMEHFQQLGTIVYLKLSCDSIAERLGDLHERGVVLPDGFTLQDLYEQRIPLYEKYAMVTIDCENQIIRDIVKQIEEALTR